jgi:Na+/melibiose symporter-like transporter
MDFSGKLSDEDLKDVGTLTRPKLYWPRLLLANWYGAALVAVLVWATGSALLGNTEFNWRAMGAIWTVIVAIVAWSAYSVRRERAQEFAPLNATLPDRIVFTDEGVTWDGPDGARGFLPWRHFNGWREGRRVVLVDRARTKSAVMLSVAHLSDLERQPIRHFLRSHIPRPPQ